MPLSLKKSLSCIEKCETINRWQKLKQVITDNNCGFIVNVLEKKNEFLGNVKQRSDGDSTDEKVDN